jgi:hypothetical protein
MGVLAETEVLRQIFRPEKSATHRHAYKWRSHKWVDIYIHRYIDGYDVYVGDNDDVADGVEYYDDKSADNYFDDDSDNDDDLHVQHIIEELPTIACLERMRQSIRGYLQVKGSSS